MALAAASPQSTFPIVEIAESKWDAHKNDCSGFVRAVALAVGVPMTGLANAMVDNWNADPSWTKLGNDPAKAGQLAAQGYLVVAGKKEAGHGHVVVIVPGEGQHKTAMGYWGRLGGVGAKNKGLNFAWKRAELADVEYFAKPVPNLRAKP